MTLFRTEGRGESVHSCVLLAAFKQSRLWAIWAPTVVPGKLVFFVVVLISVVWNRTLKTGYRNVSPKRYSQEFLGKRSPVFPASIIIFLEMFSLLIAHQLARLVALCVMSL